LRSGGDGVTTHSPAITVTGSPGVAVPPNPRASKPDVAQQRPAFRAVPGTRESARLIFDPATSTVLELGNNLAAAGLANRTMSETFLDQGIVGSLPTTRTRRHR
jgi:hypothetical protein